MDEQKSVSKAFAQLKNKTRFIHTLVVGELNIDEFSKCVDGRAGKWWSRLLDEGFAHSWAKKTTERLINLQIQNH